VKPRNKQVDVAAGFSPAGGTAAPPAPPDGNQPRASRSDLVRLDLIREPEHPARTQMDEQKMAELVDSMRSVGLLQPILLLPQGKEFEVVCGHRRLYAARELEWSTIPALIFNSPGLAVEAARIHENSMRESLNAGDEAIYLRELVDRYGLDEAGLCALVRRSPQWIADRWSLLRGDARVLQAVREGKIRLSVALELNRITDDSYRLMYLNSAARSGYSATIVAQWRREWEAQNCPSITPAAPSPTTEIEAVAEIEGYAVSCFLCGGYLDPWNLESVYIHRLERAEILRRIAAEAGQPAPGDAKC